MNCFVIMPFNREFHDVYASIRTSVEGASQGTPLKCFRLDESRPAGRITDRLLQEIQSATLCIADLTGSKPNVMWEVGYAMALRKPTIIITQDGGELPFDIRMMETLRYDRNYLNETLCEPLKRMTIDTISSVLLASQSADHPTVSVEKELIGDLLEQMRELRNIVGQAVTAWNPPRSQMHEIMPRPDNLQALEGEWVNRESDTHLYARVINGELVVPYCYMGNDGLTSVYYGWKRTGDYWFARYCWLITQMSGFAFLKQESLDLLTGAWWSDIGSLQVPETPDFGSGIPVRWERISNAQPPDWATQFFEEVRTNGIIRCLTASRHCQREHSE
jgi:hypothetical protein